MNNEEPGGTGTPPGNLGGRITMKEVSDYTMPEIALMQIAERVAANEGDRSADGVVKNYIILAAAIRANRVKKQKAA